MELEIKTYNSLPCETSKFKINGVDAYVDDFGCSDDMNPDRAEPYGCGDHRFTSKLPEPGVLSKYNINLEEYILICEQLESKLDVGACGWCV
jgi:hypothetical protein